MKMLLGSTTLDAKNNFMPLSMWFGSAITFGGGGGGGQYLQTGSAP